jgi:hypothetical protein
MKGKRDVMRTNTIAKVGTINPNHDEELESNKEPESVTVKTGIKAGSLKDNIDPGFIRR